MQCATRTTIPCSRRHDRSMTRVIRVHKISEQSSEVLEVGVEEAKQIVCDAYARGILVVDKGSGALIDEITPETAEIIVVQVIAGG